MLGSDATFLLIGIEYLTVTITSLDALHIRTYGHIRRLEKEGMIESETGCSVPDSSPFAKHYFYQA